MTDLAPRVVSEEDREAACDVLRKAGFVDPDDDTLPTFHSPEISDQFGRIKHWAPVREVIDTLISHGWGPKRQIQIDTLLAARDAAREARRLCWAEERDEHTIRHWGATAGWLASRAKKIDAGEEPDWPDAANSARTEVLDDAE